jgi:hypothetical protein
MQPQVQWASGLPRSLLGVGLMAANRAVWLEPLPTFAGEKEGQGLLGRRVCVPLTVWRV